MANLIRSLASFMIFLCASNLAVWANTPAPYNLRIGGAAATTISSLTQHGITWTFAEPVEYGQFVNGDYWVVDKGSGIKIINIDPLSTTTSGRTMHGSMLNPSSSSNGYDSSLNNIAYNATLNVGRPQGANISVTNPLIINGNASLVSSRTHENAGTRPQLVDAAILTILTSAPPTGSFRPPYAGSDKTQKWNLSDIQWNLLPRLSRGLISNQPDLDNLTSRIERVWLDHGGGVWTGRALHPSNNMPDYGRDMANITGDIALALLLDFEVSKLMPLMVRYLQLGIDWYGITENHPNIYTTTTQGGLWMGGGGHGHGRKWPIVFAGLMFNDQSILKYADGELYPIFQEEQQHFYVTQADVDRARYTADGRPREPYTVDMIGTAEWGESHFLAPHRDGANWDAAYREIVSRSLSGHILAATIMNARKIWNYDACFDYQARWWQYQQSIGMQASYSKFTNDMWLTFSIISIQ